MTCGFDSFCQILLTTAEDRKYFKKILSDFKNEIFGFVRSILRKSNLVSSDYRKRAKILIPYIKEVFPQQIEKVQDTQVVDCSCNFGDCFRFYAIESISAFKWTYSRCSMGHAEYVENTTSLMITSEDFKSLSFSEFIINQLRVSEHLGCKIMDSDRKGCQGRTIKQLSDAGKNQSSVEFVILLKSISYR